MVKIASNSVSVENIEVMSGIIINENIPITFRITYSNLTPAQKTVYTNGLSVMSGKYFTEISNTEVELYIDRMTSTVLEEGTNSINFESLTATKKNKLNALFSLFSELAQASN